MITYMLTLVGQLNSFVIPIGTANSNAIQAKGGINGATMVYGISVTDGVITYKYQVSADGVNFVDLVDSAGAAIIPPLEGKGKALNDVAVYVRIVASANVTANRTWHVSAEL